ncbi:MAG TPA: PA14 domain-containing protein [Chthoniobacteraceae bacterium]|nr:PA14 domain-containing protein [Chthoniobacteraceae bacterium]
MSRFPSPIVAFPPLCAGLFCIFLALAGRAGAQETWSDPGAQIRLKVEVMNPPDSPDAGLIATIPNGGALPGPYPEATVFDAAGKAVQSACLWNNPQEGMAIAIASGPGPFWVYISGGATPANAWSPDSPLRPSLLLYTRTGHATLPDARNLAAEDPPGAGSRMGQVPMIADAQNRFGESDDFVSYYTGWIIAPEAGEYFIGTISQDGSTVLIDGRTVADWPGMHSVQDGLSGKKGGKVTLTKGPHRIQYFQFTSEGSPRAQLIWRTPSMGANALPATPGDSDFLRSGSVHITSAEGRAGLPVALFERQATSYMDFADQFVDLFEFYVPLAGSEPGARFDWKFSDGSHAQGSDVLWPVVRGTPLTVTLTVTNSKGSATSTRSVYPDTLPRGERVDNPDARREYTQGLLNRLLGAPPGGSPAASWPPAFWQMLPQIVRGGGARDLLAFLFQHCAADMAQLSDADRKYLGDIYYDEVKENAATAPAILRAIVAAQTDPAMQFHWQLKSLDYALYEAGDIAAARQIANGLRVDPFHGGKNDAELKLIAMGDVERMAGNLGAATKDYTAAQALNRQSLRGMQKAFAGFFTTAPTPPPHDGIVITTGTSQNTDWRRRAVLENTYYTEVKNLLDQNDLSDASDKLDAWELEFPLAKLGGDYTLAEAEYAVKFHDYARAQRILKAYRIRTDLSAQLGEVMQLEWNCDMQLHQAAETKALAADIQKRFPDLPLAREAGKVLQ